MLQTMMAAKVIEYQKHFMVVHGKNGTLWLISTDFDLLDNIIWDFHAVHEMDYRPQII